jgi:Lrp/AsnC family leucine-responsive transcriptional regulator
MQYKNQNTSLDSVDVSVLEALQEDGRLSIAQLARRVQRSQAALHVRLRRLERDGFIRKYAALVDRDKMGFDLLCLVHVNLQLHQPEHVERFRAAVRDMPEVLECHHVTGEFDYLLKVVSRNREDLERFVVGRLTPIAEVARIHTSVVLREVKSTTSLPLGRLEPPRKGKDIKETKGGKGRRASKDRRR